MRIPRQWIGPVVLAGLASGIVFFFFGPPFSFRSETGLPPEVRKAMEEKNKIIEQKDADIKKAEARQRQVRAEADALREKSARDQARMAAMEAKLAEVRRMPAARADSTDQQLAVMAREMGWL